MSEWEVSVRTASQPTEVAVCSVSTGALQEGAHQGTAPCFWCFRVSLEYVSLETKGHARYSVGADQHLVG